MPVTIAASSSTHFLWNGNPMPRVYRVVPDGALDARLDHVEDGSWLNVRLGSTVAGAVPADRDALVAALAGIVSPAAAGGGLGGDVTVNVDEAAIGAAVNTSLRAGGPLPTPAAPRPEFPPGTQVDFPVAVTLADATEREIVLFGTSVPRMVATTPGSGNTVRVRVRYEAGGDPDQPPEFAAITDASPYEVRRASLDAPVYSVLVARTAGAGSAKVVIS